MSTKAKTRVEKIVYIINAWKGTSKPSKKALNRFENVLNNASDAHIDHLYNFQKAKEKQ